MFKKIIFTFITVFLIGAGSAFAQTKTELKLPDSPAGKRAAAMLKAVSQGDETSIRKFLEENADERFRNAFPMEQHIATLQKLKRNLGEMEIIAIETPEPGIIEMTVQGAEGKFWQVSIQVAPDAPNLIESLGFRPKKTASASANSPANKNLEAPGIVSAAIRSQVIEGTIKLFNEMYVFPEIAKDIEKSIRARMEKKEYDQFTDGEAFAGKLTDDLQAVSHDKHAVVFFTDKLLGEREKSTTTAQIEARRRNDLRANYGIAGAQVLPGNVGYLELRGLRDPSLAGEKVAAAMNLLSDTDALIIDLRKAPGGSGETVALIVSYFMGPNPVLINTAYFRPLNETIEFRTLKEVPGKRYLNKNVYVLTSKSSFSAAEELAYDLQTQKRATLVGETTGGGANPNRFIPIGEHFQLSVPIGRAINPITKTNWEGVGVKPDINVPAELALKTAQILALKQISEKSGNEEDKAALKKITETIQTELDELKKQKRS